MNEGCQGGWPHFNAYWGENAYFVSEECAPYQASTFAQCSNYAHCAPVAKIDSSYLVGGVWGAASEKLLMKELVRNGPFNADYLD